MIGKHLSHFLIESELGRGGMGIVYRATDLNLDREVAVKVLPPKSIATEEDRQRFEHEAKAAGRLNHPNIATIYDLDLTDPEHPLLVMELVDGQTLADLIAADPPKIPEIIRIVSEAADGLEAAHAAGIVHRDIKPSNIMVSGSGRVKILDFGLAKHSEGVDLTKTGSTTGTAAYMSPEQISGKPVDARSDVWSLGVTLYELLTGNRPFAGDYEAAIGYSILNTDPEPTSTFRDDVPERLLQILAAALDKDLNNRYSSAGMMRDELQDLSARDFPTESPGSSSSPKSSRLIPALVVSVIVVVVVIAGIFWFTNQQEITWAKTVAIPEITALTKANRYHEAFLLGERVLEIVPEDSGFLDAWSLASSRLNITTEPAGAVVEALIGAGESSQWRTLGMTPVVGALVPATGYGRSVIPLRIQQAGFMPVERLHIGDDSLNVDLIPENSIPDDMVRVVDPLVTGLLLPGMEHLAIKTSGRFLVDRYEVTNVQYSEFVSEGGYEAPEHWILLKEDSPDVDTFQESMAGFMDPTGRVGPSTWQTGQFSEGAGQIPVSGVSWYEAAAFCTWAGKQLPTIYQWNAMASTYLTEYLIPRSNFAGESAAVVGSFPSQGTFGTYDLAGNVREWVFNKLGVEGNRGILGGAWNDADYMANSAFALRADDRSAENGFRCVIAEDEDWDVDGQTEPLVYDEPYYATVQPVSDETFTIFERMYQYDKVPLDPVVLEEGVTSDGIRFEHVELSAGYGGQRFEGVLFLPDNREKPYQAIVFFPGSGPLHARAEEFTAEFVVRQIPEYLVKDGRAVFYPVYQGTYGRGPGLESSYPDMTRKYLEHSIMWSKDLGRSVDYLISRSDIDGNKLAYWGVSWGGRIGGTVLGVEHRFKAALLFLAGIRPQRSQPEVDPVHFLPRIKTPTRIVGGEHDFLFPVETSQRPFYEALKLPDADKDWKTFPGGHSVPEVDLIRETLTWFDKYLGATR